MIIFTIFAHLRFLQVDSNVIKCYSELKLGPWDLGIITIVFLPPSYSTGWSWYASDHTKTFLLHWPSPTTLKLSFCIDHHWPHWTFTFACRTSLCIVHVRCFPSSTCFLSLTFLCSAMLFLITLIICLVACASLRVTSSTISASGLKSRCPKVLASTAPRILQRGWVSCGGWWIGVGWKCQCHLFRITRQHVGHFKHAPQPALVMHLYILCLEKASWAARQV